MSKPKTLNIIDKELGYSPSDQAMVIDVTAASDFCKKYYPHLWERVAEEEILRILTIARTLFKTNPEYLEATAKLRQSPTQ